MSLVARLRRETAADHDAVDAGYGRFALDDPTDYRLFLAAHARALPAVEAVLASDGDLPPWRGRTALLAEDLAALGAIAPSPLPFAAGSGERWGALYVIEGSRLGGMLLARRIGSGQPAAYLGAKHLPGEWRALLGAIDAHAAGEAEPWRAAAVEGARRAFGLYRAALG